MSVFIDIFFIAAPLASLYVFTSFLNGTIRLIAFALLIVIYLLIIYFFKDRIREFLDLFLRKMDTLDQKKMMFILTIVFLIEKVIYTILFNYDATISGDIKIYSDIADQIIATGQIHSDAISHLFGLALHFVAIRKLGMPLHIGLTIVFYLGTMFNFVSFSKILGKNKAFLAVFLYILMPSSIMMTFSPTHEVFVYMYISIFLFSFNKMIEENNIYRSIFFAFVMIISTILTCFVNPGGYIIYIILLLSLILSNLAWKKKTVVLVCLLASIVSSNMISEYLNVNEHSTTINTYTILIHGTNAESLGEQVDGYPLKQMRMYIYDHDEMHFTDEDFELAARNVFIRQVVYLFTHPVTLVRLIMHKTYLLWSGVHYPVELAKYYNAMGTFAYYLLLAISTFIYLFVLTLGNVYRKDKDMDDIYISNYKLELLGVIALTMLCIVTNKYSLYVTLFIYLISFYRAELNENEKC